MRKLIAMLLVAGMLVTTGIGCSGDTSKDKKDKTGTSTGTGKMDKEKEKGGK
jgi:hypothetical protein